MIRNLTLEQRISRLEKLLLNKCKNEAVGLLPGGVRPGYVRDVLASWAGSFNKRVIMRKLRMEGILADSTNNNYPTPDDVENGILECFDDQITDRRGTAQFFGGMMNGIMKGTLILMPISGGDDPHRDITIKLVWNNSDDFEENF